MNACLRCKKPCEVGSVFCSECRLFLKNQLWEKENTREKENFDNTSPDTLSSLETERAEWVNGKSDPLERITSPDVFATQPQIPFEPEIPTLPLPSALVLKVAGSVEEQTVHKLNEAAQYIAPGDQKTHRLPRASRLAPLRDISPDIQRKSTPLPQISNDPTTPPVPEIASEGAEDLGKRLPDLWPWLQDSEAEENEHDVWANHTDPLIARHFPNSSEVAQIEEEDMRRVEAEGLMTAPLGVVSARKPQRIRKIFAIIAVLAALALLVDSMLAVFVFLHPHQHGAGLPGTLPPSLTLSTNAANVGLTVLLHIRHFTPSTHVVLTHDIQEPVQLSSGLSLVIVSAAGSADASMQVSDAWGPGFHTIAAEDVTTRYTASATLQITRIGKTRPSHFLIGTTPLNMGADIEGANTIRQFPLQNSGDGSISWTASSNQPWLLTSPLHGTFSHSQIISIA
ncbi:MAG: hypothetical protein M3Z24_06605, partial [Chloroflexota bacterium]|nr:hypothetical protein [Chloroflexota bacterium]